MNNRYQKILEPESTGLVERYQQEASFIAFYSHLMELGKRKNVRPDPLKGDSRISIPEYFSLIGPNPVDKAALGLLPVFKYRPGPMDTTNTIINQEGLDKAMRIPTDELEAARLGKATDFIVAKALGLLEPTEREIYRETASVSTRRDVRRHYFDITELVIDITRDFDGAVVGEVKDVAASMQSSGHKDFLDYLTGVRTVISKRIETLFSGGVNLLPEDYYKT